jgi:hypothetical protein
LIADLGTSQTPSIEAGLVISVSGKTKEGVKVTNNLGIGATVGGKVKPDFRFEEEVLTVKNLSFAGINLSSSTKFDVTGFKGVILKSKYKWKPLNLIDMSISTSSKWDSNFDLSLNSAKLGTTLPLDGAKLSIASTHAKQKYDRDNDGLEEEVFGFDNLGLTLGYSGKNLKASTTFVLGPEFNDVDSDGADEKVAHSKVKKKVFKLSIKINKTQFNSTTVYSPHFASETLKLSTGFNNLSLGVKAEFTATEFVTASFTLGLKF